MRRIRPKFDATIRYLLSVVGCNGGQASAPPRAKQSSVKVPIKPAISPPIPDHACQVFFTDGIFVAEGVNQGDGLGHPDDVCLGDIYELDPAASPLRMTLDRTADGQRIADGGQVGVTGDGVDMIARYTLMAPDGDKVELLFLCVGADRFHVLPLSPMGAGVGYALVLIDRTPQDVRLTDLLCISFARGTMITLGNGAQTAIEDLVQGDKVLTRDHGAQPVRWLGRVTLRAVGAFAPVVITKGTLGNAGDLIVSQHHRMFLYQRQRHLDISTSELLVQAKHLIDDKAIFLREGGYVDYFSVVFDQHEIIYAEGVPAESLMVTEATLSRLPEGMADDVKSRLPGLRHHQHFGTEAGRSLLDTVGRDTLYPPRRTGLAR